MADFIGDFLTVLRNAYRARKEKVTIPTSEITLRITEILKKEGYIENYKLIEEGPKRFVRIHLKYLKGKQPAIRCLSRISKPGLRQYVSRNKIPRVLGGLGLAILSTSRGILTDKETQKAEVGGEVICKLW